MIVEAVYGMKASDLEDARNILDQLLDVKGEARENSSMGGDYYLYEGSSGSEVYVMKNEEPEDGTPLFDETAGWGFILQIVNSGDSDPWLMKIKGNPDLFTSIIYDEFE